MFHLNVEGSGMGSVVSMTIPLGPEDIDGLVKALEQALIVLGINDRNHPMTELVAKRVFEIRQMGVRDPAKICRLAVHQK
jgi:hypothetical protein